MKKISVLKGDGIGPEVVNQALKVLDAVSDKYAYHFKKEDCLIGAVAIDELGTSLPDDTLVSCKSSDAILLGAIGDPRFDNDPAAKIRPEQGLLKLRKELELFCNVRPIKIYDNLKHLSPIKDKNLDNVDFVIYRELTGGIYFGDRTKTENSASDLCLYHDYEIERIARKAYAEAIRRDNKLCLVDKANVLESSRLWRQIVQNLSQEYPSVELTYMYVDNAAMQMILNPSQFDVIVTSNMFGDIISDEASVLSGSLGLLPSASYGTDYSLYEPCHGSYPQAKGKDIANPLATILSVEIMLRDFGYSEAADDILNAVALSIKENKTTIDLNKKNPQSCSGLGDYISQSILQESVVQLT